MKFKKIISVIALILLLTLTGCGKEKVEYSESTSNISKINLFDIELQNKKIDFDKMDVSNKENEFTTYYYYLEDEKLFVVHEYDSKSEEYKKIENNGKISRNEDTLLNIEVVCNNGLVLEKNANIENFNEIEEALKNIK